MKNTYTITAQVVDRMMLADLLDAIEGKATNVEIKVANGAPKTAAAPAPKAAKPAPASRRSPKRSKVNDTIRDALARGAANVSDLKERLISAGMSAASLSTGIAALTKAGEIERVGDGQYALKAA